MKISVDILGYNPDQAADVCAALNRGLAGLPHCYPLAPRRLIAELSGPTTTTYWDDHEPLSLSDEAVLIARDGPRVVGFGHAGLGRIREQGPEQGVIRFLWYEEGHRREGQALLEALERHLGRRGATRISAFHQGWRHPFYHLASAYLSDRLGHVHALMGWNGYRRVEGEVYLDWPDMRPAVAPLPDVGVEVAVELMPRSGRRPDVIVRAMSAGAQVGVCSCNSARAYADDESADAWCFCHWLHVEDLFQGRGLGRHLLTQAMAAACEVGYRHGVISTAWDNYRAALFYSNVGFRVVDWTYGLERSREDTGAHA